jgi:hypothetical protein
MWVHIIRKTEWIASMHTDFGSEPEFLIFSKESAIAMV